MSDHEPKIPITPTPPEQLLDLLMPWGNNSYGTPVRGNKNLRLHRSDTILMDRYSRSGVDQQISRTATMWTLNEHSDDYSANIVRTFGHFHRTGSDLVGFCPNEELTFSAVTKIVSLLPKPEPTPISQRKRRAPTSA